MASTPLEYMQQRLAWRIQQDKNGATKSFFEIPDGTIERMWSKNNTGEPVGITKDQYNDDAKKIFHLDSDGNIPDIIDENKFWNGSDYFKKCSPLSEETIRRMEHVYNHIAASFETGAWQQFFIAEQQKAIQNGTVLTPEEITKKKELLIKSYFFRLCGHTSFAENLDFKDPSHKFSFAKIFGDNYIKSLFNRFNRARMANEHSELAIQIHQLNLR